MTKVPCTKSQHLKLCWTLVRLEKASGGNQVRVQMSWYQKILRRKGRQSIIDYKVLALNNILGSLCVLYVCVWLELKKD